MTGDRGRPPVDVVQIRRRKRRFRIAAVVLAVVLSAFVVGLLGRIYFADDPESAADTIQVSVPDNATEVSYSDGGFSFDGECIDLEFLIPVDDWSDYVAQYYSPHDMRPIYMANATCGVQRIKCDRQPGFPVNGSFNASDSVTEGKDEYRRSLGVVPNCQPGMTRIAWRVMR